MGEVVIVEAVRTPIGKRGGVLSSIEPIRLTALVLREVVRRAGIEPGQVDDVIVGCVTQIGEQGLNVARLAALDAGFPVEVTAVSVNRQCGSSEQALHFAAQAIAAGDMEVVIAAGVESMSRVPMGSDYPDHLPADFPYRLVPQGIAAEMMAEKWGLTREALDRYSYDSHVKAARATAAGRFATGIVPLQVEANGRRDWVARDEGIRWEPDLSKMAALPPAFQPGGVVTAGNSSQISDGAAAVLLMSVERAAALGVRPKARVVARAVVGTDPVLMLAGPIPATDKALTRAHLTIDDMDVIEVNEAFASVVLAWMREIEPPLERVNPNGGAIALGHPLGCSGARLMTTLLQEMERRQAAGEATSRFGLQTMCIGQGQATATIVERRG
jgi:acetyl-CoA acyltransferase